AAAIEKDEQPVRAARLHVEFEGRAERAGGLAAGRQRRPAGSEIAEAGQVFRRGGACEKDEEEGEGGEACHEAFPFSPASSGPGYVKRVQGRDAAAKPPAKPPCRSRLRKYPGRHGAHKDALADRDFAAVVEFARHGHLDAVVMSLD